MLRARNIEKLKMRAEIESDIAEIEQAMGLLRRHL
jgi:hypothetical protein